MTIFSTAFAMTEGGWLTPLDRFVAHRTGYGPDLIGIGAALCRLLKVIGGDAGPFGADIPGPDQHDIDPKGSEFHPERVTEGLHRILRGVVPTSQRGSEAAPMEERLMMVSDFCPRM